MAIRYARTVKKNRKATPQSRPIPGRKSDMIKNDAGGFAFKTSAWTMLDRFLIIGTEGGTFYVDQRKLTKRNFKNVLKCLEKDGKRVVERAIEISEAGRAATNDPALFVLALAMSPKYADQKTRYLAARALPRVARTASHLFTFVSEVDELRGWGKFLRKAVASWYEGKKVDQLGYQITKYRGRRGWTHRDILRKAHPKGASQGHDALYKYIARGIEGLNFDQRVIGLPKLIHGVEAVKAAGTVAEVTNTIQEYRLTHEMVPNDWKREPEVWGALLQSMPIFAMIRNLGVMTSRGLLKSNSDATRHAVNLLLNKSAVRKARIHPISVLKALATYNSGSGFRGKLSWTPVRSITDALIDTFYSSFGNVKPTGKNIMLGIDVSASMYWGIHGKVESMAGLTCSEIVSAMMMVTFRSERHAEAIAFADKIRPFNISRHDSLEKVVEQTRNFTFGGTDCALPMIYALDNGIPVDAFVIYTDGDTWAGKIHPMQALKVYREKSGYDAKLVVVNIKAQRHSIADPLDPRTLDVVGFDSFFPAFLSEFVASD